jgi:outer membrane protein OmpA-like peptidoglycan-associated protein
MFVGIHLFLTKNIFMMQCTRVIRQAAVVMALLILHPGCKIFQKSPMDKQAKAIRQKVPDVDVTREGDGIAVSFKPTVLFEFDKAEIPDRIKNNLDWFAAVLQRYADSRITVRGYTDDMGTESHNLQLSEERAKVVKDYLVYKGVSSSRLTVKGYGATAPKYANDTEANRAKNRRVEFLIMPK